MASAEPRIDWGSAEVSDGRLAVGLEGELPKGWGRSFEATAHVLGHGEWRDAKVRKGVVRVPVGSGDEERLRHFLESVVQQVNADHELSADDSDEERNSHDEPLGGDAGGADVGGPDAQMTERFRAFQDDAR
jgi:hypothetical protein